MKVFVAGATGMLGIPLVRALVAQGHQVVGMTRSPEKQGMLERLGAEAVVADALDAVELIDAVRASAPTHVVHLLSALPKHGPLRAEDMAATNLLRIEGTANLIRAAVAAGVQRIVGESFIYVYGYGDHGPVPKTEGDPPVAHSSDPGLQAVARALRSLERQLVTAAEQGQIEAIVPRFGLIYGPENRAAKHMVEMLRRRRLPLVRNAIGIASLIHVDDAVSATIAALERGAPGAIYNIVDDEPVPINAYIAAVARMSGAPRPYTIPRWLARLAAPAAYAGAMTRLPVSNAKARRELGWRPRFPTFREGVPDLVERLSHTNIGGPMGLLEGNAL